MRVFTGVSQSEANMNWPCRTLDSSLHAELEAIERAICIVPTALPIHFFIDCTSAIALIQKKFSKYKDIYQNEYSYHAKRIQWLLNQRTHLNLPEIVFEWIPSHIKKKLGSAETKHS